jgi:hypothetical protein
MGGMQDERVAFDDARQQLELLCGYRADDGRSVYCHFTL